MPGLYTPMTIKKIRQQAEIKRDFLTGLFFSKSSNSATEVIVLEYTKSGEAVAPYLTPLEAGRPVYNKTKKSNVITAPSIGPEYTLTAKDLFERAAGQSLEGFDPVQETGKRIGEILKDQENYIKNREELMVSQFLTTGIVKSGEKEVAYEVNYELGNKVTLESEKKWTNEGINPLKSIDAMIQKAEESGYKTENVVLGLKAADILVSSKDYKNAISTDLQSEFVKKAIRVYPGIIWLGTYKKFGVELFSYSRVVIEADGTKKQLMPTNMVIGGPSHGEIIYAPIVFMADGIIHLAKRYSNLDTSNPKIAKITTESRPVLQPCDVDAYFSYVVCEE